PLIEKSNPKHIVFLNSPGPFFTFYSNDILRFHFNEWKDSYLLSSFNGEVWVKQISDSSILLKTTNEGWLSNMFSRLIRTKPKLESGDKFNTKFFTATIVRLTQNRDEVLEVRFDFKELLNNESLIFLYFDGERFSQWKFDDENFKVWKYLGNTSDVFRSML
ncbi:MAG: hypothetical protein N3A61_08390, partial [Ignavibacteria bacterium]|nr:hypothetical protein [Ignavibacteria bacterium]